MILNFERRSVHKFFSSFQFIFLKIIFNGNDSFLFIHAYPLGLIFFELLNFFHTETERYKVLQNIKNQKYPDDFTNGHKNEVRISQYF